MLASLRAPNLGRMESEPRMEDVRNPPPKRRTARSIPPFDDCDEDHGDAALGREELRVRLAEREAATERFRELKRRLLARR